MQGKEIKNPDICPLCKKELGKLWWPDTNSPPRVGDKFHINSASLTLGVSKVWFHHFINKHPHEDIEKYIYE